MNSKTYLHKPPAYAGYSDDSGGSSRAFSWWRASDYEKVQRGVWLVLPIEYEFGGRIAYAVMDDFGNLRKAMQ